MISSASPSSSSAVHFVFTLFGLYAAYLIYGWLQERITSHSYSESGSKFSSPQFLMLVQCFINAAFALPFIYLTKSPSSSSSSSSSSPIPSRIYALMALTYSLGMLTSYIALDYISYPSQVLVKSTKMLPVMIVGLLLYRKRYSLFEYICVSMITAGIFLFFQKSESADAAPQSASASDRSLSDTLMGVGLSILSLTMDGLTGSTQDEYCAKHHPSSAMLMYQLNKYSTLFLLPISFFTGELFIGYQFLYNSPEFAWDLFLFSSISAIGQGFIFTMVTHYGALPLAIATSTRKFFTILASVFYFGHSLSEKQWLAVGCVFTGLLADIGRKATDKRKQGQKKQK